MGLSCSKSIHIEEFVVPSPSPPPKTEHKLRTRSHGQSEVEVPKPKEPTVGISDTEPSHDSSEKSESDVEPEVEPVVETKTEILIVEKPAPLQNYDLDQPHCEDYIWLFITVFFLWRIVSSVTLFTYQEV